MVKPKIDPFAQKPRFSLFDKVMKPEGYPFPGTVVSIFRTRGGDIRIVVEHDCGRLLHIFNELQLRKV